MKRMCIIICLYWVQVQSLQPAEKLFACVQQMLTQKEKGVYLNFSASELTDHPQIYNCLRSYDLTYKAIKEMGDITSLDPFFYEPLAPALLKTKFRKQAAQFFQELKKHKVLLLGDPKIPESARQFLFGDCAFLPVARIGSSKGFNKLIEACIKSIPAEFTVVIFALESHTHALAEQLLAQKDSLLVIDLGLIHTQLIQWAAATWEKWFTVSNPNPDTNRIKILYTSALIPQKFAKRKEEYIKSLNVLASFGYNPYIAEATGYSPDAFFDLYCDHVLFANSNDLSLRNKGINETKAMRALLDYYDFDEEDMLVKLTGRYFFHNDSFLQLIKQRPDVDAFATHPRGGEVQTGCFAMKAKYFKQMLAGFNLQEMEDQYQAIEYWVAVFLQKMALEGAKVLYVDKAGITANVNDQIIIEW